MAAVAIVANYTRDIPELGEGQGNLIATGS
jgi:hypothetical protein